MLSDSGDGEGGQRDDAAHDSFDFEVPMNGAGLGVKETLFHTCQSGNNELTVQPLRFCRSAFAGAEKAVAGLFEPFVISLLQAVLMGEVHFVGNGAESLFGRVCDEVGSREGGRFHLLLTFLA